MSRSTRASAILASLLIFLVPRHVLSAVDPDMSRYSVESGVTVTRVGERLTIEWPLEGRELGQVVLDLRSGRPLFGSIAVSATDQVSQPVLREADPVVFVVVGERRLPGGEPPGI